jgi:hypothetical protein
MTNLDTKFTVFEGQITDNHTEIIEALNSIIDALGGVPPTPTTTLSDVATLLTSINSNLTNMRAADALFYAATNSLLDQIATNTDTIINNNSLNAQRILAAIMATACACDTTTPLLPDPLDVTPSDLADEAKCRRIQFYLSVFSSWLSKIANYGGAGAFITGDVVGTLLGLAATEAGIAATGAEVGAAAGPPGVVIGAIVGLIIGAVGILGASVLTDYAAQFAAAPLQGALLAALFAATNADEGQTAFQTVIGDNFSTIPAGIINALWWSAWSNDLYSGTPVVDDSAFDGSICVPPVEDACYHFSTSEMVEVTTETGTAIIPNWSKYGITPFNNPGHVNPVWVAADWSGWTFNITSGTAYHQILNDGGSGSTSSSGTVTSPSPDAITFISSAPFALDFCPPV